MQLTPVFLAGESCGQRTLAGYSPWGQKEPCMLDIFDMMGCYMGHVVWDLHFFLLKSEAMFFLKVSGFLTNLEILFWNKIL